MAAQSRRRERVVFLQKDPGPWTSEVLTWLVTLLLLLVMGLVMLFSASYTTGYLRFNDSYHFIRTQLYCTGLGLFLMFGIAHIDYRFYRKWVWWGYLFCLALLGLVLRSAPINGCRRWLRLPFLPTLQVSELVKFEMILLTAHILCRTRRVPKEMWKLRYAGKLLSRWIVHELLVPLLPLIPVVILLTFEPHYSAIILICAMVGTMLLLTGFGGPITYIGAGASAWVVEWVLRHAESVELIQKRLDGWTQDLEQMTDQTRQSLYAIGSGGVWGVGLGNSVEKQIWLPECTNDFVFSVVCEELGFVGAVVVILLFVLFIVQGLHLAFEAADLNGTLVGIGIMAQIAWQMFCNVAVVTNTLPNTGISLPFFSSGGTSLLLLLIEMGVVLNIARNGAKYKSIEREDRAKRGPNAGDILLDEA